MNSVLIAVLKRSNGLFGLFARPLAFVLLKLPTPVCPKQKFWNSNSIPQVTLSSYTFENVTFHVLHERIPLFTFRTLSDWWDHRTALNRWRTIDHYVRRCRGNVRILEAVDFIGRTSELARLFGILFFSVISRGSQVFEMLFFKTP